MSERKMIAGLCHKYACAGDDGKFFAAIDACGGWPVGYLYIGFEHTNARAAGFTNSPHNDGWWTVVASADDYFLWKLSPQALQRIVDAAIGAVRLPKIDAQRIWIKSSRGYQAAISSAEITK